MLSTEDDSEDPPKFMLSLSAFAVKAPVKVTMIFVAILLLGWISLNRLPTNLFPDIRAPKVTVTVRANGLSPTEVERRLSEVIERSLYTIRGVTNVQTISRADMAVIVVEFTWDTSLDYAFLEVKKAASDLQRDRSEDVESVTVLRYDPNAAPIITLALSAPDDTDPESVLRFADQTLRPRFERLEGVANVELSGGMEREVLIALDEALMLTYGIEVQNVVQALQQENVDATGGWVEEGARRYLLKSVGRFQNVDQVKDVTVGRSGNSPILLTDVAQVSMAPKEPKSLVYFNGNPAVGMAFYREAESNTVAVADFVRKEMKDSESILPEEWKLVVANDQSQFIRDAIREVRNNALFGGLLAVLVLLFFLGNFRSTVIIAVAIPVSIIATFNLMYFQGLTLNLMTLGGLALGTGMLVDNAIVVLENIFRLKQEGMDSMEASRIGAKEVGGALVASTLTTVAVFLPIVYVKGVAGLLFKEQALTVAYSLLASLIVALLLIPMLSAYFLKSKKGGMEVPAESLDLPRGLYPKLLRLCLRLRLFIIAGSVGLLYLSWIALSNIPQEFLPPTDVHQVGIRLVLPNGTPIQATDQVVQTVDSQLGRWDAAIENVYARVGEPEGVINADSEDPDGPNTADIFVTLRDWDNPTTPMLAAGLTGFTSSRLIGSLKPILERIPDAKVEFNASQGSLMELIGSSRAPLLIEISGQEIDELTRLAGEIKARLEPVPELLNVRTNILQGAPEVRLRMDKTQLARYGLDVNSVAQTLRRRIDGEIATEIKTEAGDVDLNVKVDYGRESLENLRNITLKGTNGALVRLANVAEFEIVRGPREIVRRSQERIAYVMADLSPDVKLSTGITAAQAALEGFNLPRRYFLEYTGEEEQRREAFGKLQFALLLSILLVYMVMASIFESFLQPFLILLTIPLAGVGIVFGLITTAQTLNVMSIIGIVMLGGIVVNNAIVLLDCVNQVRGDAKERKLYDLDAPSQLSAVDTLVIGCTRRLRPVLMTTATTLLGLLPMALGFGDGAELRQAMAITVLGGLLSSTILTLFVIPCCQSYLDSVRRVLHKVGDKIFHRHAHDDQRRTRAEAKV